MFKLNPTAYGSVFALPSTVVENYIKLASELQLKVLLLIAKNSLDDNSSLALSKILNKNESDVSDALDFWVSEGILVKDGEMPIQTNEVKKATDKKEVKRTDLEEQLVKELPVLPIVKPTMEQLLARINESGEIKNLFNEAQVILGRTIGFDCQSTLLMMHDHYGLKVEVILTLLHYLQGIDKSSVKYISATGKQWAEKEIDSLEKANEYIDRMNSTNKVYLELSMAAGLEHPKPSSTQAEYIASWCEMGFSSEIIIYAYDYMTNNIKRPSFPYVNKILTSWNESGYKTIADVKESNEERKKTNNTTKTNTTEKVKKVSYDLDKAKKKAKYEPIKIEKRKA